MVSGLFRLMAALGRNMIIAMNFGGFAVLILFALGGFVLARGDCKADGNDHRYVTPSQSRLGSVNLSGLTHQTPMSQVTVNTKSTYNSIVRPFQLPASRISPRKYSTLPVPTNHFLNSSVCFFVYFIVLCSKMTKEKTLQFHRSWILKITLHQKNVNQNSTYTSNIKPFQLPASPALGGGQFGEGSYIPQVANAMERLGGSASSKRKG